MKKRLEPETAYKFFCAANSRRGFVNFFEDAFSRRIHKKVYILKGGPGTGKSTLLKKLCAFAKERGLYNEAIYCSSDVDSLDGVIISDDISSVCVFDGTAPHSSDTRAPGAIDVLVDLGRGWNERELEKRKNEILDICEKKNFAYAKAYAELAQIRENGRKYAAENEFWGELNPDALKSSTFPWHSVRLISAFSKNGYTRFDTLEKISRDVELLEGDFFKVQSDLKKIRDDNLKKNKTVISIPSPLDTDILEGVYTPDSATTFFAADLYGKDAFVNALAVSDQREEILKKAQESLKEASRLHFELEDIYTPLMDFSFLDFIYADLVVKIAYQLQI